MVTKKPWVDGPYDLISSSKCGAESGKKLPPARAFASEMIFIHNNLIRGINAVTLQCENVARRGSDQDKLDFANFAFQWAEMVEEHHSFEESTLFPGINDLTGVPDLMDGNVQEHAEFHAGLQRYSEFLQHVKDGKEPLDGERLKAIIDSFMPALHSHLVSEVDTLLGLEQYEDKVDWQKWFNEKLQAMIHQVMSQGGYRTNILPLGFILHDKTFDGGVWRDYPPIPWWATLILRWFYLNKRSDWWRFAGCDTDAFPKELPFA